MKQPGFPISLGVCARDLDGLYPRLHVLLFHQRKLFMCSSSYVGKLLSSTLTPFLYPCLDTVWSSPAAGLRHVARPARRGRLDFLGQRRSSSSPAAASPSSEDTAARPPVDVEQYDHLNTESPDYSATPFADACTLTLASGGGGHGCISFLREKYIANGPPNGGDGGTGGNVYIQAVRGETSLHKIARRPAVKAGRGGNGQGGLRGGKRGEDVILVVPVGTVVREVSRVDIVADEMAQRDRSSRAFGRDAEKDEPDDAGDNSTDQTPKWRSDKWLLYPGAMPRSFTHADFPPLPRPRRSNLALTAPPAPINVDFDRPMSAPVLIAAGGMGGLGNPHFVTKSIPRPMFGTKGDDGVQIRLQLELKLLADVGLVGLPNAGKSTLLRALTSSRARVGNWAFTTLSPNIGTVVLDPSSGPASHTRRLLDPVTAELRTHFTIADNPGLIEDAHLDKGLGLGFLRHIERAGVLAFVVDLAAGDAIQALKGLWKEVGLYQRLRDSGAETTGDGSQSTYTPFASSVPFMLEPAEGETDDSRGPDGDPTRSLPPLSLPPISSKPWLVVATKADLPGTRENFARLREYLARVQDGAEAHPSGKAHAWKGAVAAVPVCAMKKEGAQGVLDVMIKLLGRT